MIRFRKGELNFYKSGTPKELKAYLKELPFLETFIEAFLNRYRYNYVQKEWVLNKD